MFIARQPIFNKELKLYGYELLFRPNIDATSFGEAAASNATATVLGNLFEMGIDQIVEGVKAFVNFDYDFLFSDSIELIDANTLVIEVLETVKADKILVDRLNYLRSKGYKIALDDFVECFHLHPLVPIADIIKYDLMITPLESIEIEVKQALKQNKILLAEKIETENEFILAKEMGFDLFQGYFFSKPSIISKSNDKKSAKSQYTRIISELNKEEPSFQILAEIIETDVNLAFRLMKVISIKQNRDMVYSIKKALIYMGFKELERWINILMLQDLSTNKPKELLKLSLLRSKFGEFIASNSRFKNRNRETSMMCLFSTLDAILDETMEEVLQDILITEDIREALIKKSGVLSPICNLISSYEKGDWDKVKIIAADIGIDEKKLPEGYLSSLKWTTETLLKF